MEKNPDIINFWQFQDSTFSVDEKFFGLIIFVRLACHSERGCEKRREQLKKKSKGFDTNIGNFQNFFCRFVEIETFQSTNSLSQVDSYLEENVQQNIKEINFSKTFWHDHFKSCKKCFSWNVKKWPAEGFEPSTWCLTSRCETHFCILQATKASTQQHSQCILSVCCSNIRAMQTVSLLFKQK